MLCMSLLISSVWEACKTNCMCHGDPITSQGNDVGENCPCCSHDDEGEEVRTVTTSCANTD